MTASEAASSSREWPQSWSHQWRPRLIADLLYSDTLDALISVTLATGDTVTGSALNISHIVMLRDDHCAGVGIIPSSQCL